MLSSRADTSYIEGVSELDLPSSHQLVTARALSFIKQNNFSEREVTWAVQSALKGICIPASFEDAFEYTIIKDLYPLCADETNPTKLVEPGVVELKELLVAYFLLKEAKASDSWEIPVQNVKISKCFEKLPSLPTNSCALFDRVKMGRVVRRILS